ARHGARRGPAPRGPLARPDPRGECAPQGIGARGDRPHQALAARRRPRRPVQGPDRGRNARRVRGNRRPPAREELSVKRILAAAFVVLAAAGCGTSNARPKEDPRTAALRVVDRIVHNRYAQAWGDLHSVDQKAAPLAAYVACETHSPVLARPRSVKVVSVNDESVGLGDGKFLDSTSVDVRMTFAGDFHFVHS